MPAPERELKDYLNVLRRRKGVVALAVAVVVGVALLASFLQTPVYQGAAEILLQPRASESLFNQNSLQLSDPERTLQTEIRVIKSQPVRAAVQQKIGSAPKITAGGVSNTNTILIRANSTDSKQAAAIANAYANAYIDYRRKQVVNDLLAAANEIQKQVTALQRQVDTQPPGPSRDALQNQQSAFKERLDQLNVDAALRTGGAQLVTPATEPTSPIKPRPMKNAVLGLVAGLMLGVGAAFLFDYLDDSLKSKEDLEAAASLPTVGMIPSVATWRDRHDTLVITRTDPASPAAEAYRTLRTSIQFMGLDRPMRTIQITSSNASEGKTTTLTNLGVVLARAGQRVILVCCDLRRPRLNTFFGLPNTLGFTSVLLGDAPLSAALQQVPGEQRLLLLSSGPLPPNPSELLSSKRTTELLAALQANCDVVLLDSPPVLPVTDAAVLAGRVDATLLVATARTTTLRELTRAAEILRQVGAPLIGTVLNGITDEQGYGYSYSYEYYRRNEPEAQETARPARPA